jgi:PilZ domain
MAVEKGWMEQRRQDRISATVNVTYRILEADEKLNILQMPRYSETSVNHLPRLAQKFHSYHAVTKDISEGGLSITGEQQFIAGEWVEVSILPPKYITPVTMLAEMKWARSFTQVGKPYYTAGVKILALDSESMDQLSKFLLTEKIKRDNESNPKR